MTAAQCNATLDRHTHTLLEDHICGVWLVVYLMSVLARDFLHMLVAGRQILLVTPLVKLAGKNVC